MRAVVERYFAAINSDSFGDLAKVFAEDVEIHTVGAPAVAGREAALGHFPKILAGYAEHEDRVTRWIEATDAITTEIDFAGRLRDGRPITFSALDVFDLRDGLITKVTTWYDTRALRRQLVPPQGLHHLGVRVGDLGRSIGFYHALGAKLLAPPRKLGRTAAAMSMGAENVRVALAGFPDGTGIELFSFDGPVPEWCRERDPAARLPHLGIRVTDVDATLAAAEAAGGERLWAEPGFFGPVRVIYLRDPDGTVLELLDGSFGAIADVAGTSPEPPGTKRY
ncbi:nuclear transport factor 2 family protein [Amycolatopsis acidicola]|uniref:nuclear transport factor 2 family protein n=1 Tax=Amycolatopsis acidicola TaxID=2596893 RepID=UPI0014092505|nr:nuclear transport factor 2 family protein [Amycolatopsis acidicola]